GIVNGEKKLSLKKNSSFQESDLEEILRILSSTVQFLQKKKERIIFLKLIDEWLFGLALINEIHKEIQDKKLENNIIFISDIPEKINKIITSEPVPFIYERVGEKYHHFLIDEFQDTSLLQWENFVPLMENTLSEGYKNIIVGDGKQAIYRFRSGDVEQFLNLPHIAKSTSKTVIAQKEKIFKDNYFAPENVLNTNFRSGSAIVEFNNTLFNKLKQFLSPNLQSLYQNLEQKSNLKDKYQGYVRMEFVNPEKDESYNEVVFSKIKNLIENLSPSQKRNNSYYKRSDLAVLTRNNQELVELAEYLLQNGIQVISAESLLVQNSPDIHLLFAFLYLLENEKRPQDKAILIDMLSKKNNQLPEKNYSLLKDKDLRSVLQHFKIETSLTRLKKLPLYELVYQSVRLLKINPGSYFVLKILDTVHEYVTLRSNSLPDFLEYWEENKEKVSINLPVNENAVQLVTIHKSKGLSYPVVIMPKADWEMKPSKNNFWHQNEEEPIPVHIIKNKKLLLEHPDFKDLYEEEKQKTVLDNINLLYVALTRPEEQLYLFAPLKESNKNYISSLYRNIITAPDVLQQTEEHIYESGKPLKKISKQKRHSSPENILTIKPKQSLIPWNEKIRINYEHQKIFGRSQRKTLRRRRRILRRRNR
ncbi:MAG: hypothetical protein D6707_11140, partial [Bacteroidetes bacterium]